LNALKPATIGSRLVVGLAKCRNQTDAAVDFCTSSDRLSSMSLTEVPYSSFLRGPSEVLPALEHGDVRLERRDAEALVVTRVGRYQAAMLGIAVTARMLRSLVKQAPDLAESLLSEELPWLTWMPPAEQMDCLSEVLNQLAAGAETGTFEPFARTVTEWEHTAEVWATPELARRLTSEFLGDGGDIAKPRAARP
jgi:hypothetical protein